MATKGNKEKSIVIKSFEAEVAGELVNVPSNKIENRIASMASAALMRKIIEEQLVKIRSGDIQLTPRELRDLAETLHTVSKMSGEIYETGDEPDPDSHTDDTKQAEAPDFSKIIEVKPAEPKP